MDNIYLWYIESIRNIEYKCPNEKWIYESIRQLGLNGSS